MLSTDSTKRAILYARVSTDEQARSGYSLTQQLEALREYALREGYQIVQEISDPGQSGASLERPGIDEVRALVREGTVSLVLAQDRDRFAREPAYHYLLRKEFEEYGCRLKALNDHGGDTPEGELTDGILDQLAKYERAKTTERTRRGRYRRAREGKIVGNANSHYGFSFNEARDAYVINEEEMCVVRRVFRMIGAERMPLSAVKKVLDREGVPLRGGGRFWSRIFLKRIILEDVYKPHTYEEIDSLVSPEVAARLDPARSYGIWWYGQHRWTQTQIAEGGRYRRKRRIALRPPEEWIAVPVPDSGVPRQWVEAARAAVSSNKPPSTGGGHTWELSGGILRCGTCGARMEATFSKTRTGRRNHYYRCSRRRNHGKEACANGRGIRVREVEPAVWEFVCSLLRDPNRMRQGVQRLVEREEERLLRTDANEHEVKMWARRLRELERKRSNLQDMAAEGLITFSELGTKLDAVEEARRETRHCLEELGRHQQRLENLRQGTENLVDSYSEMVPEGLEALPSEERHRVYQMIELTVTAHHDGSLLANMTLGSTPQSCAPKFAS